VRKAFEPKGAEPRWKIVYRLFENAPNDEVVTYHEIAEALDANVVTDLPTIQNSVYQAAKRLLRDRNKALDNVRGKGYRVVEQVEHYDLAHRQQRKATRRLKAGHAIAVYTDMNGMSMDEKRLVEGARRLLAAQLDFNRRTDLRLKDHDKALAEIGNRQDRTEEENAEIRDRLSRLEERFG
jgi:DNA-binding winged helix-turn-helix (wHTH) protein